MKKKERTKIQHKVEVIEKNYFPECSDSYFGMIKLLYTL